MLELKKRTVCPSVRDGGETPVLGRLIFFARKIQGFRSTAAIKQQRRLCRILVGAAFVVAGGMRLRRYDADDGGDGEREDKLNDSEAVGKVRETAGSGMIIGGILCLFLLRKLPILLAPLSFSPLHGRVTRK